MNKITDTLTHEIFNDGRIDLGDGKIAFRPLGLETVLEKVKDRPIKPGDMQTSASLYAK